MELPSIILFIVSQNPGTGGGEEWLTKEEGGGLP